MNNQYSLGATYLEDDQDIGFDSDAFHREDFAQDLLKLLSDDPGPLVVALDAPWGSGKSTFLKMFLNQCWRANSERRDIVLDSFAGDFGGDAIATLTGAFLRFEQTSPSDDIPTWNRARSRLMSAMAGLKRAAPQVIGTTAGALMSPVAGPFTPVFSQVASAMANGAGGQKSKEESPISRQREKFRDALRELVAIQDRSGPVLIVIDELDRCDPFFALELLSKIKHLFDIEGVVFLLACQMNQLEDAIAARYGQGSSGATFLQKLVHLRVTLPRIHHPDYGWTGQFLADLLQRHGVVDGPRLAEVLQDLSSGSSLAIRDLERIATVLAALQRLSGDDKGMRLKTVWATLAVLSVRRPDLLSSCVNANCPPHDLYEVLGSLESVESRSPIVAAEVLLVCGSDFAKERYPEAVGFIEQQHSMYPGGLDALVGATARRLLAFQRY